MVWWLLLPGAGPAKLLREALDLTARPPRVLAGPRHLLSGWTRDLQIV